MFTNKKIAVLGAGCAGLAAALSLARKGFKVFIFEQDANVGGLGGGVRLNGNIYEYGPHLFHATDRKILDDIKGLAGDEMFPVDRSILIKFYGDYFKFPLSILDVISKLPKLTILNASLSLFAYKVRFIFVRPKNETSETVLLKSYGRVLYEIFFKNYIERVWGIGPCGFSPKFARQRIAGFSAFNFLVKLISGLHKFHHKQKPVTDYVENVEGQVFSTKKGFSAIAEKMGQEIKNLGGEIFLNSRVTKLSLQSGRFKAEINSKLNGTIFDGAINTMPINYLAKIFDPALPEDTRKCAERLKFRAIVFVGLLVNKERVLPASILYFRESCFNRVTDLSYFGFEIFPAGSTLLVAELACDKSERFWNDDLYSRNTVIEELIKEGLISAHEVKESHVFRNEYAYPVYSLGFEEDLKKVLDAFNSFKNLRSAGRQGLFNYVNIHVAIKTAYEAAQTLENYFTDGR